MRDETVETVETFLGQLAEEGLPIPGGGATTALLLRQVTEAAGAP